MPEPEVTTDVTTGAVVSICSVPAELITAPERKIELDSKGKSGPATRLSETGLLVSCPVIIAFAISVGDGNAGICGYADDPTTVPGTW